MAAQRQPQKLKVFISYSRRNLDFVDKLQAALKARGIDAAVDRTEIAKGEEWWKRIQQLITEADTVIFVLSPASAGSRICHDEVDFAEKLKKRIISIVAEGVAGLRVPDALARLNYVFFIADAASGATGDFDTALDDLVRALETDIGWVREHTRIGALAQRWQGQGAGQGRDLLLRGAELEAAERWLAGRPLKAPDLSNAHIAFLAKSRKAATRRQRWTAGISVAAAVVAFGLAGLAYFQFLEANSQRATTAKISVEAQTAESGLLSKAAKAISDEPGGGDAPLAMLLALEGMQDASNDDARQASRPPVTEAQFQLDRAFRNNREQIVIAHRGPVSSVAWSPDGRLLATASSEPDGEKGEARVFEVATGRELARIAHDGMVRSVAWSSDGRLLATGSEDKTVRIVEVATGRELARIAHDSMVRSVAWSSDGRLLATGSNDKTARIVEAATGKEVARIAHDAGVNAVAWSPDGRLLATGSDDKTARIVEAATGKEVARIAHDGFVRSVAWSPDGRLLATGSEDKTARIVEVATGRELARIAHDDLVLAVAWSPDGRLLTTSSSDLKKGEARIFEVATGQKVAALSHDNPISVIAFSPDGRLLATASGNRERGEARVFDVATHKELGRVLNFPPSCLACGWARVRSPCAA